MDISIIKNYLIHNNVVRASLLYLSHFLAPQFAKVNDNKLVLLLQVDDKYLYSCDNIQNQVHGWMCDDPGVGFWMITPSNEFRNGGPTKQDLTSHTGPTCLAVRNSFSIERITKCLLDAYVRTCPHPGRSWILG